MIIAELSESSACISSGSGGEGDHSAPSAARGAVSPFINNTLVFSRSLIRRLRVLLHSVAHVSEVDRCSASLNLEFLDPRTLV